MKQKVRNEACILSLLKQRRPMKKKAIVIKLRRHHSLERNGILIIDGYSSHLNKQILPNVDITLNGTLDPVHQFGTAKNRGLTNDQMTACGWQDKGIGRRMLLL
jgi:hypothetical protein